MVQNMENIDFRTFFAVTSQQWPLLKRNCDFWVPWNISDQIHRILCPNLVYFLRKCTKSSKIRPRGAVPPQSTGTQYTWQSFNEKQHRPTWLVCEAMTCMLFFIQTLPRILCAGAVSRVSFLDLFGPIAGDNSRCCCNEMPPTTGCRTPVFFTSYFYPHYTEIQQCCLRENFVINTRIYNKPMLYETHAFLVRL